MDGPPGTKVGPLKETGCGTQIATIATQALGLGWVKPIFEV